MIDPKDCYYIIHCYPDNKITTHMVSWLHQLNALNNVLFLNTLDRQLHCQYNEGVERALQQDLEHIVFCDNDIRPSVGDTWEFFQADADIVGAKYPTGVKGSWQNPELIHCALWRTRKSVLKNIAQPWFMHPTNEQQTKTTGCVCGYFCEKAYKQGFTITQAGYTIHDYKRSICTGGKNAEMD